MVNQKRNFRFPIFNDDIGAKDPNFKSPYVKNDTHKKISSKEIEVVIDKSNDTDKDDVKQQSLYRKNDVSKAIQDKVSYNDLKNNVAKKINKFTTSTIDSAFTNYQNTQDEKVQTTKRITTDKPLNDKSESVYNSFSNEPVESLSENKNLQDVEKIPLVKREMLKSKEMIEDSVPFHRKHKK